MKTKEEIANFVFDIVSSELEKFIRGSKMIIVYYKYYSKKEKKVKEGQAVFYNRVKALAFMYKCNDNPYMFLEAYSCDDPWDNDWLNERIHLAV